MAGPAVFIGYRRDDVPDVAGRVYDRLAHEFGRPAVFKDVDAIPTNGAATHGVIGT